MAFKDKFSVFQNIDVNDRLLLRQVELENDLENYYEIYSDENVFKYYSGCNGNTTYDRVKRIMENQINEFKKGRIYSWTIANKEDDKALGRILLSNFDANNKIANIGYFISQKQWGKGIVSACVKPVIEFGFSYLNLERIGTRVHIDNIASQRVLEHNGFVKEGLMRHCFETSSGLSDCYIYSKLSTD